jgi:Cupin-like domain
MCVLVANITTGERFERNSTWRRELCDAYASKPSTTPSIGPDECTTPLHCNCHPLLPIPMEYTLNPGSVLFIPAFWFHEVTSVTNSASISLWWEGREWDIMDDIYELPLPFDEAWSAEETKCAAFAFIGTLLEVVEEEYSGHRVERPVSYIVDDSLPTISLSVQHLLQERYSEELGELDRLSANLISSASYSCANDAGHHAEAGFQSKSKSYASKIASAFMKFIGPPKGNDLEQQIPLAYNRPDDTAIMAIKIADFIEDILQMVASEVSPA